MTFSGWLLAFSSHPARPNSTNIRSVPADTTEQRPAISRLGPPARGTGTSTKLVWPVDRDWRSWIIASCPPYGSGRQGGEAKSAERDCQAGQHPFPADLHRPMPAGTQHDAPRAQQHLRQEAEIYADRA